MCAGTRGNLDSNIKVEFTNRRRSYRGRADGWGQPSFRESRAYLPPNTSRSTATAVRKSCVRFARTLADRKSVV